MDAKERFALVKRNTAEILTEGELRQLLELKKHPVVYIGTAVTGAPHIGYFVWATKLADFIKAGFKAKVLLADIHGALDNTPWELLEKRFDYYTLVISALFDSIGVDSSKVEIVKGSDFQLGKDYVFDVLKLSSYASVHDCLRASSEVVKHGENPKLSGLLYPVMQSIDEEYLNADVQFGGVDQRKIFVFARESLPKIGYASRVKVITPLVPGLTAGGKMSSSDVRSKIGLLDDEKTVFDKLNNAFCEPGIIENNGVLAFLKYVIMVKKADSGDAFVVDRPAKFGGPLSYRNYAMLEADYSAKQLHPADLKKAVAVEINHLLEPIRKKAKGKDNLIRAAYPANK